MKNSQLLCKDKRMNKVEIENGISSFKTGANFIEQVMCRC